MSIIFHYDPTDHHLHIQCVGVIDMLNKLNTYNNIKGSIIKKVSLYMDNSYQYTTDFTSMITTNIKRFIHVNDYVIDSGKDSRGIDNSFIIVNLCIPANFRLEKINENNLKNTFVINDQGERILNIQLFNTYVHVTGQYHHLHINE